MIEDSHHIIEVDPQIGDLRMIRRQGGEVLHGVIELIPEIADCPAPERRSCRVGWKGKGIQGCLEGRPGIHFQQNLITVHLTLPDDQSGERIGHEERVPAQGGLPLRTVQEPQPG